LNIRILLRRIRERQYARLAKGDVDGLVGVTPEGIEHARELRLQALSRRLGFPDNDDDDAEMASEAEDED
jgi:hypothetical protein